MAGKNVDPRSRKWSGQCSYYYATHDANGNVTSSMTVDEWKDKKREEYRNLVKCGRCRTIVWIFHDNDVDKDGQPKGVHVHVIVFLVNPATQSAMMTLLGITREKDCEYIKKNSSAFRYLLHVTDKAINDGKYIYNYTDIELETTDGTFDLRKEFIEKKKDKDNDVQKIIEELHKAVMTGAYVLSDVRRVYMATADLGATAWRRDKRKFDDDIQEYMHLVNDWYATHNCCKTTIMISGGGGSQKTDLAQMVIAPHFADKRGVHVPAAPMGQVTYDPVGTYEGQLVSILNEIKGTSWILEGFCECLDATHAGLTGARYHDKPFFPWVVCMTTSDSVDTFISEMYCRWLGKATNDTYKVVSYWNGAHTEKLSYVQSTKTDIYGEPIRHYEVPKPWQSVPTDSEWDKVWQVRRRIPIVMQLENGVAHIDVLDYNKRNCALVDCGAYIRYADIPYSVTDEAVKAKFLETLDNAIGYYYQYNKFTITPWTFPRPQITL